MFQNCGTSELYTTCRMLASSIHLAEVDSLRFFVVTVVSMYTTVARGIRSDSKSPSLVIRSWDTQHRSHLPVDSTLLFRSSATAWNPWFSQPFSNLTMYAPGEAIDSHWSISTGVTRALPAFIHFRNVPGRCQGRTLFVLALSEETKWAFQC